MDKQVLIVGLGVFGQALIHNLEDKPIDVIAVDKDPELINELKDRVTLAVCLDSTDSRALQSLSPENIDVAIVTIGEHFEYNLLTSVQLKELGVRKVIARAYKPIQKTILKRSGVDAIITPEELVAHILADDLTQDTSIIETYMKKLDDVSTDTDPDGGLVQ